MKSIVGELEYNKEQVRLATSEDRTVRNQKEASAWSLLIEAIKAADYDPSEVVLTSKNYVVNKKETNVRISLRPKGYELRKSYSREMEQGEPEIVVHIRHNGDNVIHESSLSAALVKLVDPNRWSKEILPMG